MVNPLTRAMQWISKGISRGPVPSDPINWWQSSGRSRRLEVDPEQFGPYVTCVGILSQDIARLPVVHLRIDPVKGKQVVTTSAASRVFRKPNHYQTKSDLMLYLMRSLLSDGNGYAYATRNARFEVDDLYPLSPKSTRPYMEEQSKEVFYQIGGDPTADLADVDAGIWVPQREILHLRLQTPRHPLVGESPIVAAMPAITAGTEINAHNAAFFGNMSRPSGILRHPGRLEESAMNRIKARWKELTTGPNTGDTAVLSEGMEWEPLTMNAVDAELINSYNLTERQVAQIYRVPSFLLSDLDKASLNNVESLMRFYVMSALGYYVNLIEENMRDIFKLPNNEYIRFDLESAMLRGDLESRLNALGKGVQNGIYSPNEARQREDLPEVEFGDDVRVQQQLVPLSFGADLQPTDSPAPGTPAPEPEPEPEEDEERTDEERSAAISLATRTLKRAA